MAYENNHKIVFTARVTGTSETQIFVCPYGQNVRFRLLQLNIFNENGAAQNAKIFDHKSTSPPSDPPAQGDATTPLMTLGMVTADHEFLAIEQTPPIVFQQGMAVVLSGAASVITATVEEA